MAIQVQPLMIEMRWTKPVGASGSARVVSRTENTLLATKHAKITRPVGGQLADEVAPSAVARPRGTLDQKHDYKERRTNDAGVKRRTVGDFHDPQVHRVVSRKSDFPCGPSGRLERP